jgi:hypothetical protein
MDKTRKQFVIILKCSILFYAHILSNLNTVLLGQ